MVSKFALKEIDVTNLFFETSISLNLFALADNASSFRFFETSNFASEFESILMDVSNVFFERSIEVNLFLLRFK